MTGAVHPGRRGQPLVALALLLGGWVVVRVAVLEHAPRDVTRSAMHEAGRAPDAGIAAAPAAKTPRAADDDLMAGQALPAMHRFFSAPPLKPELSPMGPPPPSPGQPDLHLLAGHQILLMAGLGYLTLPEAVRPAVLAAQAPAAADRPTPPALTAPDAETARHAPSRWSGEGWLFLRGGAAGAPFASSSPAYGASQAGAVARYRLGSATPRSAYLYARVTGALNMPGDTPEAALGAGLRPVAAVPVRVLAEVRARRVGSSLAVRPAIAVVSELAPVGLPGRFEGEVYARAGYVGGRDATAFFDLQALAERTLARPARGAELRIGGGAWAGGQRGVARLDLGPRVALRVGLGQAASRVALDWRVRVAGNASPASSAALTVSAGF